MKSVRLRTKMTKQAVQRIVERGDLPFSDDKSRLGKKYSTVLLDLAYNGMVYDNTPSNLATGFRRLTMCIRGDIMEHTIMRRRQSGGLYLGKVTSRRWRGRMHSYLKHLRANIPSQGDNADHYTRVSHFVAQEHVKQKLRMRTYLKLQHDGKLDHRDFGKPFNVKIKTLESAKPGKRARVISNGGVDASFSAYVIPQLKYAFSVPYETANLKMYFCKSTETDKIEEVFDDLNSSVNKVFCIYHSDDSIFRIFAGDRWYTVEVDISGCDASQGQAVFDWLSTLVDGTDIQQCVDEMIRQCTADITLDNPHDKYEKITFQTSGSRLMSGSGLTTVLNNVITSLIALRFSFKLESCECNSPDDIRTLLTECALSIGYKVSVDVFESFEESLFLKNFSSGCTLGSGVALGTILRAMTRYRDGDVPGSRKLPIRVRFDNHLRNVLLSYQHSLGNIITDSLCDRFGAPRFKRRMPNSSITRRYGITEGDLMQLAQVLRDLPYGVMYKSHTMDRIFEKDYGYRWPS